MLLSAKVKESKRVLILGGTTSTGFVGIKICDHFNVEVFVTCSSKNESVIKTYTNNYILYDKEDFGDKLKGYNFDIVYDCVGVSGDYEKSKNILREGGIFISIVNNGSNESKDEKYPYIFNIVTPNSDHMRELIDLLNKLNYKPRIHKVYTYEESIEGMKEQKSGKCVGKVVVSIN